jgi:predicted ribosomally synthesized peptide with SipW-like signal peptide
MRKILGLTIAALLVIGLAGVGTWAYFSDTETASGNVFTAGTLDLTPDEGSITTISYAAVDGVAPGWDNASADSWTLTNSGSVDGDLTITIGSIDNQGVTNEEPEGDDTGDLGGNLDIVFWADLDDDGEIDGGIWADGGGMNGYMDIGEGEKMYEGDLDTMPATFPASGKIDLDATEEIDIYFDASIGIGVGNSIMSDSATFDITFNLDQTP